MTPIHAANVLRERAHWRAVAKAEGTTITERTLLWVALYRNGQRRAATPEERERGVPVGWWGR